ncbi:MAG: tetratricopeptide repeat protein [Thermodesulfobacteriota bacterium]
MNTRLFVYWLLVLGVALSLPLSSLRVEADVKEALALNQEGEKSLQQGKYTEALETFRKMSEQCGSHQYCRGVAAFYQGRTHAELAKYDDALKFFDEAEQIFIQLNKENEKAMVLAGRGSVLAGRGDYKGARDLFAKAEATFTEKKNSKELYSLYNNIAVVLAYMCDFDQALAYLEKAQELVAGSDDPKITGSLNVNRGLVFSKRQDYEKALAAYDRALKSYQTLGNLKSLSILLNNVGYIHEARSEYAKALEKHEESLKLAREVKDPWCESLALNNIGCVQLKRGDYQAAKQAYEGALKIRNELGIKHFAAESLNNLGLVWLAYADYPRAFACFDQCREACDLMASPSGRAWALHNMAFLLKDQGKFKESLTCSEDAARIAQQIGDKRLEATAILRLGNLYEYQGWFDKALENYRKAAEIQQTIEDWNFRSNTIADAANILTRSGEFDDAEVYFQEAIKLKRKIGAPAGELLCKFALFYLEKDRYAGLRREKGEKGDQQRAADLAKASEQLSLAEKEIKPDQRNDLMLLTYVKGRFLREKDLQGAVSEFAKLKEQAEQAGVRKFSFLAAVGAGLAHEQLTNWQEAKSSFKQAVEYAEYIRKTLDEDAKLAFLDGEEILGVKHILPYEGLARVLMKKGENAASFTTAEYTKARAFSESLARRWENPSFDVPVETIKRDADLNNRLAALMKGLDKAHEAGAQEAVQSFKIEIAALEGQFSRHVEELRRSYPLFAGSKYPGPLELGHSALRDQEWMLAYDVTETGILVYLSQGKRLVKSLFKPISRDDLDALVRTFRAPLEIHQGDEDPMGKLKSFDLGSGKTLADIVLGEILVDLPAGMPVIVVPDDSLGVVPFEMLVLNDTGKLVEKGEIPVVTGAEFFGDRNPISYYQSVTALTLSRTLGKKKDPSDRLLVVADPVFQQRDARAGALGQDTRLAQADAAFSTTLMTALEGGEQGSFSFNRLPLTGELAEGLQEMFQGKSEMYVGLDASKKTFIQELAPELDRYGRMVFATHGFFSRQCPHFREPILVLTLVPVGTDGFLRMSEVMGLKINSDVVALTACQTGLGKHVSGEGTMGMGRAFQYAGARAVLMSLWSVSEEASVQLVETFFTHLKEGKSKLDAMKLAREKVRKDGYDHPFFWAPFILVGEVN